jgi:hypothetical protein
MLTSGHVKLSKKEITKLLPLSPATAASVSSSEPELTSARALSMLSLLYPACATDPKGRKIRFGPCGEVATWNVCLILARCTSQLTRAKRWSPTTCSNALNATPCATGASSVRKIERRTSFRYAEAFAFSPRTPDATALTSGSLLRRIGFPRRFCFPTTTERAARLALPSQLTALLSVGGASQSRPSRRQLCLVLVRQIRE